MPKSNRTSENSIWVDDDEFRLTFVRKTMWQSQIKLMEWHTHISVPP